MGLLQVVLDWFLMLIILLGKIFYWLKLIKEDTSILMEMMKYLIFNDVVGTTIILFHDIPSYFMAEALSEKFGVINIIGTFSQCLPFFFALLMLPIFSLLNLIAIIAVYRFVTLEKASISRTSIILCYLGSSVFTLPLVTQWCGFTYNSTVHYWYYDYDKPYTAIFQTINIGMQILCMSIVAVCMSLVMLYLAKRAKRFSSNTAPVGAATMRETSSASSNIGERVEKAVPTTVTHAGQKRIYRSRPIIDQGFAFIVLSLCFIMGTTAFNLLGKCDSTVCLVVTVITGNLNRAKWIIYCFLMRQDATISRIIRLRI